MGAEKSKNLCRRSQVRRVQYILKQLKEGKYPNCSTLAKELETTTRTVARDIEHIKDSMCVPVEYDPHKYGYYLTGPIGELPWITINQGELVALILAEKALDEFAGTPFEQPLHTAMNKLSQALEGSITFAPDELDAIVSFHDIEMERGYLPVFQIISDALNQRREITFKYLKPQATKREHRTVQPYHLACIKRQWYLFAFDHLRQDIRRFVLSRMSDVMMTENSFVIPKDFSIQKHLSGSFGVHSATGNYDVKIRFTGLAATLVQERKWHKTQKIFRQLNGAIELQMHLTSLEEVEGWILGWGPNAEVLKPIELREEITKILNNMAQIYSPSK